MTHPHDNIPREPFAVGPFIVEPWEVDTFAIEAAPNSPIKARVRLLCGTEIVGQFAPCGPTPMLIMRPQETQS